MARNLFFIATLLVTAAVAGFAGVRYGQHAHPAAPTAATATYVCPMHPEVVQDHPGTCPICKMKLVAKAVEAPRTPAERELVVVDAMRQQLIGLKTAPVDRGVVARELRAVARVAVAEPQVRRVTLKVPGFVEHVFVDFVGKPVRKGQPLFTLYSPELVAAENELLIARRSNDEALLSAARRKLELWDVPAAELERLEREGTVGRAVTFVSPVAGVVTRKELVEGSRLELGAMAYEVSDLSTVWVTAELYESELRFVTPGLEGELELGAFPDRTFRGKVLFVDPVLDAKSRTARVRLSFANPGGELRPELFGELILSRPTREVTRIPKDALVRSGTGDVAFVMQDEGHFEPRDVKLGEVGAEYAEVLSGVSEGERVVTHANFLIDSESKLRASLNRFRSASATAPGTGAAP